jgi:MFS family permease
MEKNIRYGYISAFLTSLIFVIPIWVAFQRRVLSFSQMAFLVSLEYGAVVVLELPTGALADLIGRRKTIIIGWLLYGLANIYLGFASSFFIFLSGFMARAVGGALISGADTALMFDTLKELGRINFFPRYMSRAGLIYRTGLAIASFFGGYLYQVWIGLPHAMMGVFELLAVIFIFLMIEPKIDTEKFSVRNYLKQARDGFKQILQSNYMRKLTVFYTAIGGITWASLTYFNQTYVKSFGFTELQLGWLFSGLYLTSSLMILFVTENEKLLTRNRVYLGFPIIMMFAFLPGIWASKVFVSILILGTIFCGSGRFAILDKYANKEFLSKYRATAVSALNMLVGLFYIVLVSLGGRIQDAFGVKIVFTLLGVLTMFLVLPSGVSLVLEYKNYLRRRNA